MVNNSTNINKTNNNISPKENLSSEGQQTTNNNQKSMLPNKCFWKLWKESIKSDDQQFN